MNVTLVLLDVATGDVLAETESDLDSLPRSFAGAETTLELGDSAWSVVRAEPESRDEIARAGRVRLTLRRVEKVDPKKVLFSLPTLEDALPASTAAPEGVDISLRITPDDWRQFELVEASQLAAVDAEVEAIRRVHETQREGSGFRSLHVRHGVPTPLASSRLTVRELEETLGAKARPFALRGEGPMVRDGFAIPCAEALVYGVAEGGVARVVGVYGIPDDVVAQLHPLALAHHLVLVDWCRPARYVAREEGFAA